MLAGKMDVIAGVSFAQRMVLASIPFGPKKLLLRQVRRMQEIDDWMAYLCQYDHPEYRSLSWRACSAMAVPIIYCDT